MAWGSIKNILIGDGEKQKPADVPPGRAGTILRRALASSDLKRISLDAIGQRDEVVRQRVGVMIDRLEDLDSLREDFAGILEPLVSISEELPRATVKIAELESALSQDRQALTQLREEAAESARTLQTLGGEVSDSTNRAEQAEAELRNTLALLAEHQATLRDKSVTMEHLERQLFTETEQNAALLGENKALRSEVQAADLALTRSEGTLRETQENLAVLDRENQRIQALTEEQVVQLESLRARHDALENTSNEERQRLRTVEAALAAETLERERIQAQYEQESGAHRNERAGLIVRLDSSNAKLASTEQVLAHAHRQLREREETHRASDRSIKEAAIARTTAERRVEALQADINRQRERFLDMQQLRTELSARCDMLTKALAAKDATIEQANARNNALAERIERLNGRHDGIRNELETANRRLTEDLENERSERLLAQGALDMARESRSALQKQHDSLKRSMRGWRDNGTEGEGSEPGDEASNVRPFSAPKRPDR